MNNQLKFCVPGRPRPQGSKRIVQGRLIECSRGLPGWRKSVTMAAIAARQQAGGEWPILGPTILELRFHMTRPWTSKPDIDKLARSILDALVQAGVLKDDAQVVALMAYKLPADSSEEGAVVEVYA